MMRATLSVWDRQDYLIVAVGGFEIVVESDRYMFAYHLFDERGYVLAIEKLSRFGIRLGFTYELEEGVIAVGVFDVLHIAFRIINYPGIGVGNRHGRHEGFLCVEQPDLLSLEHHIAYGE